MPLHPIEIFFNRTAFDITGNSRQIKEQYLSVADSIHEGVRHYGLVPRTREQIKINNIKTILPYAEVISLALNGHPINATPNFLNLLDSGNYLGALLHLPQDLKSEKIIKVGFTEQEVKEIRLLESEDDRRSAIARIFNKERFQKEWKSTLSNFTQSCTAFSELDMPHIQKVISFLYLRIREPVRLPKLFRKIESTIYT